MMPHAIFVRQRGRLSDEELLARLGLGRIVRRDDYVQGDWKHHADMGCVFIGNDPEWTCIVDNNGYVLENWSGLRDGIARWVIGDTDDYCLFEHHRDGKLVRKRVVDPRSAADCVDFGPPLPIESEPDFVAEIAQLPRIARSLGIDLEVPLRAYSFVVDAARP